MRSSKFLQYKYIEWQYMMYKVINYGERISGEEIAYDAQQSFANEHDVIKQLVLCKHQC